ncbi:MAG: MBL fold metallo-hydrolase [Bacteroidetes bacterium]|nr:MBL fold metallo-hydrolase [Bacteroidota bacterium]
MNRRSFLGRSAAALALVALPAPLRAFPRMSQLPFTPIRRGTGIFTERGGTIGWLIRDGALVVVDSQFPESAATCRDGLVERSNRTVDLLINSHHHGDHTAGNAVLGEGAGRILAHANVPGLQRQSMREGSPEPTVANVTYQETWSDSLGDETISLHYFGPAHTAGDSIIHFEKADVVHMGDLVFNYRHPYIDLGAGADTANWMTVLERARQTFSDNTVFIYGHSNPANGILGTREDLLVMRDYLGALRDAAAAGIQAGKSADETASDGLQGFQSHWMNGSDDGIKGNIATIFEEMQTVHE